MGRRWIAAVLSALLAVQAPVMGSTALSPGATSHASSTHCAGHMAGKSDCPCCPNGLTIAAGCMTLCAAVGMSGALPVLGFSSLHAAAIPFIAVPVISRTDIPPNPPPIV